MNKCFFIGDIIEVSKFKFILKGEHKSKITIKIRLLDEQEVITVRI